MKSLRSPLPLLLALALTGCGVETYHARIVNNTMPFFQYQQELNTNLGPRWRQGEVSLRLPSQLKSIPAPKKKKGEQTSSQPDPRIPRGLNVEELTGLLGGFRGELDSVDSAGKTVAMPFTAMVLSNRSLLTSRDKKAKPDEFDEALLNRLSEALGGAEIKSTPRHTVGGKDFAPSLAYELVSLESPTGRPATRFEIYVHRQGRLQVAIVFGIPQNLERMAPVRNQIELSLQTLRLGGGNQAPAGSPSSATSPAF